jgi:hypothetical protein
MHLWLASPPPSMADDGFASEEAAREAWFRHRAHFMAHFAGHGKRPMGWWWFESPVPFPGYFKQRSTLYEHNLLDVAERAELLAYWRQQFERAGQPHFFVCEGPGEFFEGAIARRKHYEWADIPASLVEQWTQERRRARKTIRELERSG